MAGGVGSPVCVYVKTEIPEEQSSGEQQGAGPGLEQGKDTLFKEILTPGCQPCTSMSLRVGASLSFASRTLYLSHPS